VLGNINPFPVIPFIVQVAGVLVIAINVGIAVIVIF
jgi:hypothetical protein